MFSTMLDAIFKNKLTPQQKHATLVLSIGTFLEYFDMYLYIHMAFILDKIFFPPGTTNNWFLSNLTLCTNFMFRPIGAIILGWLGDNLGRKSTIFISTTATAICCTITALLPSYEKIGITAAYTLAGCRSLQGIFSSAEVQGARIYLIEVTENLANKCFLTSLINCITTIGRFAAIAVASIFINFANTSTDSWRNIFWAGSIVALVGAYARSSLKETQEFADASKRLKKFAQEVGIEIRKDHPLLKSKLNIKDTFFLFALKCGEPLAMFFAYSYCAKAFSKLGLSNAQSINYSTYTSCYETLYIFALLIPIFIFSPLKINRFFIYGANVCYIIIPIILEHFASPNSVFISQLLLVSFWVSDFPAGPIFYKRFPVLQRYTSILMINALSRAITWPLSAFGIRYLTENVFGHYGLYFIFIPVGLLGIVATRYFAATQKAEDTLEKNGKITVDLQNT